MEYLTADISDIDWRSLSCSEIDALLSARIERYESAIRINGGKRPKREGHIIERIATMDNLLAADDTAQKGNRNAGLSKAAGCFMSRTAISHGTIKESFRNSVNFNS